MKRFLLKFDWLGFAATAALLALGVIAIWSSGNARSELVFHGVWKSTLVTAVFGLVLYFLLAYFDYRRYLPFFAAPAFAVSLAMLVAVLVFGSTVYGGRRWLWFFQPSEIAKLCVLTMLAWVFARPRFHGFLGFLLAVPLVGVPALLILAEPDLGTALTLVPAAAAVLFAAGVWRKGLITIAAVSGLAALAVLGAVYEASKPGVSEARSAQILRYVPLKAHQVKRVRTFLFPDSDVARSGYNLRQAKISIGSGGLTGKGIGKGESNHLKYLPQSVSMNDFIFCVYAEETGYVGSLVLLTLFGVLLLSGVRAAYSAGELSGSLLAIGVTTLVFAHVYINIAMSIGLLPITGLPLPFISSGRTFLITVLCGFGLVQSVIVHTDH